MRDIKNLTGQFLRKEILQQQTKKVEEKLDEQNQEQLQENIEAEDTNTDKQEFQERGNELLDAQNYIAMLRRTSARRVAKTTEKTTNNEPQNKTNNPKKVIAKTVNPIRKSTSLLSPKPATLGENTTYTINSYEFIYPEDYLLPMDLNYNKIDKEKINDILDIIEIDDTGISVYLPTNMPNVYLDWNNLSQNEIFLQESIGIIKNACSVKRNYEDEQYDFIGNSLSIANNEFNEVAKSIPFKEISKEYLKSFQWDIKHNILSKEKKKN